jgi:hypothetical protein
MGREAICLLSFPLLMRLAAMVLPIGSLLCSIAGLGEQMDGKKGWGVTLRVKLRVNLREGCKKLP